jgi:hypothetical protein
MGITPVVSMPVSVAVPPAVSVMISPGPPTIAWIVTAKANANGKAPSGIRVIMYTVTIGWVTRIIIVPVPWIIIITCSVYYNTTIYIRACVTGSISYINHFGSVVIYIYIFHVVYRAFGRDLFNILWPFCAHRPGSLCTG